MHGAHTYNAVQPLPAYYESGEVSPASTDDSSGTFYDSPHQSDSARLVDDRGCPVDTNAAHTYVGLPAAFPGYERASQGVITAEQYSYPAGQEQAAHLNQSSPTYYSVEATSKLQQQQHQQQQPATGLPQLSYSPDYTSDDNARVRSQEFDERPSSGDNHRSLYPGATVQSSQQLLPTRTQSPMAHLPYPETEAVLGAQRLYPSASSPFTYTAQTRHVAHPQPLYPQGQYVALQQQQQHPHHQQQHHHHQQQKQQ